MLKTGKRCFPVAEILHRPFRWNGKIKKIDFYPHYTPMRKCENVMNVEMWKCVCRADGTQIVRIFMIDMIKTELPSDVTD